MEKIHYLVQTNLDGKRVRFDEDPSTGGLNVTIGDVLPDSFMFLEQADILLDAEAVHNLDKLLGKMYINHTGSWPKNPKLPLNCNREIAIEEEDYVDGKIRLLVNARPFSSSAASVLVKTPMELREVKALRNMLSAVIERAEDGE